MTAAPVQEPSAAPVFAPVAARVIGIAIGNAGALALVDGAGRLVHVADMPVLLDGPKARPTVNAALLAGLLRDWQPERAYVEFVGARPTDGPVGAFAFGKARGHVEAVLAALEISSSSITPAVWKRIVGIPPGTGMKSVARAEASRRWPAHAGMFARVKDDGRAEPALIAVAGLVRGSQGR